MTPYIDSFHSPGSDVDLDSVDVVEIVLDPIAHRRSRSPKPRSRHGERHRRRRTLTLLATFLAGLISGVAAVRATHPQRASNRVATAASNATVGKGARESTDHPGGASDVTALRPTAAIRRYESIDVAGLAMAAFIAGDGGRALAALVPATGP